MEDEDQNNEVAEIEEELPSVEESEDMDTPEVEEEPLPEVETMDIPEVEDVALPLMEENEEDVAVNDILEETNVEDSAEDRLPQVELEEVAISASEHQLQEAIEEAIEEEI